MFRFVTHCSKSISVGRAFRSNSMPPPLEPHVCMERDRNRHAMVLVEREREREYKRHATVLVDPCMEREKAPCNALLKPCNPKP